MFCDIDTHACVCTRMKHRHCIINLLTVCSRAGTFKDVKLGRVSDGMFQIDDLRLSLTRQEREHARREEMLKQEIADLQQVE